MNLSFWSMFFGTRALVVKKWKVDVDADVPVRIEARRSGIMAWLMSLLKLDSTTVLELHGNHVSLSEGSLAGQLREIVPLTGASNIGTGYLKPFGYVLAAVASAFWAIVALLSEDASGWAVVLRLAFAIGFVILYFLNRCLVLYVIPVSNSPIQIALKRSVIEGVDVNEESAKKVIDLMVNAIMDSVRKR